MNIFYFLHSFSPNPIVLSIGGFNIYWYGVVLALAMILALAVFLYLGKIKGLKVDDILDVATWLIIGGVIGARIYDVILELPYYLNQPLNVFKIWQGGLAIHGGIIGGLIVLLFFSKFKNLNFWKIVSALIPALTLGQAVGRFGNWFNQELFGRPSGLPWSIPIDFFKRPAGYENYEYFQPTFLYESLLLLILFIITFTLVKYKKIGGKIIFAIYLIGYGLIRFGLEFIKIDATPVILNLRWPQFVSLIMILVGVVLIILQNSPTPPAGGYGAINKKGAPTK